MRCNDPNLDFRAEVNAQGQGQGKKNVVFSKFKKPHSAQKVTRQSISSLF